MVGKTSPVFCPPCTFSKRDLACCLPSQPPLLPMSVFMVIMLVRAHIFFKKLVFFLITKELCAHQDIKYFLKNKKRIMYSVKKTWKTQKSTGLKKKKDTKKLGDALNPDQPL